MARPWLLTGNPPEFQPRSPNSPSTTCLRNADHAGNYGEVQSAENLTRDLGLS